MKSQSSVHIIQKPQNTVLKMAGVLFIIDEKYLLKETPTYKSKTKEYLLDKSRNLIECSQEFITPTVSPPCPSSGGCKPACPCGYNTNGTCKPCPSSSSSSSSSSS